MIKKIDLVKYFSDGCKLKGSEKIGTEHEKFIYNKNDLSLIPFHGDRSITTVLKRFVDDGWKAVIEEEQIVGATKNGASVTLEPGGQFELSGAPLNNLHETCREINDHLSFTKSLEEELDIGFLGIGFIPLGGFDDMAKVPKKRYQQIMTPYMRKVGGLGLEMMYQTCTVQANFDFISEKDMAKKVNVSAALQPLATGLFANSPFKNGKPNGFLSYRSHIWTDTDNDRCGTIPFVFEDGFGFERYVDYILDVPMYFVYRNGVYIDASGQSFRDFMIGKLPALPGELPTIKDWEDQMSVAFPEVRLKQFLEMRGTDGGSWASLCALPAFWVGLLYDNDARHAAYDLIKNWTPEEHARLRTEVPTAALKTKFRDQTLREVALQVLEISHAGLKSRHALDSVGLDETHYLKPLFKIAETGQTQAEELLCAYERQWKKSVIPVYSQYSY